MRLQLFKANELKRVRVSRFQVGYWGAMEQKSSIRKMSNDFLEDVGCAPQRAQLATTYGFWK